MPKIVMYVSGYCPYCTMAEKLLRARGVEEIEKIRVDLQPGLRAEMMQRTGRRTVPQIYIGPVHVGGTTIWQCWTARGTERIAGWLSAGCQSSRYIGSRKIFDKCI